MMQMQSKKSMWWVAGALALGLTGCSNLPKPPQSVVRYDLGAAPALAAAASKALQPIALAQIQAPLQVEGNTGLRYRLAYADDQELHTYAQSRWSVQPEQMVLQRLREHLGQGGRVVLSAQPGEMPPLVQGRQVPVLSLSLEEFSQLFTSARESVGWVRIRATLVDPAPRGDVLLAQQVFEVRQPAAAANAAGGAKALSQAVDAVGAQMQQWLLQVVAKP